jgi:YggT family protein
MENIPVTIVNILYWALFILIFARIIFSYVNFGPYALKEMVFRVTEPILAPVRRMLPATAGLDFSPMIVLLAASVIRSLLFQIIT